MAYGSGNIQQGSLSKCSDGDKYKVKAVGFDMNQINDLEFLLLPLSLFM